MPSRRRPAIALLAAACAGLAGAGCSDPLGADAVELQQQVDRLNSRIDFLEEQLDIVEADAAGEADADATTTTAGS